MNQFLDTLSVFIANILRLKPTSWQTSKKLATEMRKAHDNFKPSTVNIDGQEVPVEPDASPFSFLGDAVLNALGFIGAVWLITKVVTAFVLMLPYLLALAAFGLVLSIFATRKTEPQPV